MSGRHDTARWAAGIGPDEVEEWNRVVGGPLLEAAGDPARERAVLAEAVVRWATRLTAFLDELVSAQPGDPRYSRWQEMASDLFVDFVTGQRITDRVDEDERRVLFAADHLADPAQPALYRRLFAEHVLALPEGHPRRDVPGASAALHGAIDDYRGSDPVGELAALAVLVDHDLVDGDAFEAVVARGEELLAADPASHYGRRFLVEVAAAHGRRAIEAREGGDREAQRVAAARQLEVFDRLVARDPGDVKILMARGVALELLDRLADAAEAFEAAATRLKGEGRVLALENAGRMRANVGDWDRAVAHLRAVLDASVEKVVTELALGPGESEADRFGRLGRQLVLAHANRGEWDDAVDALDRQRSLRFRARAAWRLSPAGRRLVELERRLWAIERGVPDPGAGSGEAFDFLADVTPRTALLEAYRRARPGLDESALATPTPAEVAAVLRPGEVVVSLALLDSGTAVAVLGAGPRPGWRGRMVPSWPFHRWAEALAGDERDYAFAIGAPEADIDRPAALRRALATADEALRPAIEELVPAEAPRVTVVPHRLLHLIPWWAVPVLDGRRVRTAASLAQLVNARRRPARPLAGRAVVAADPTLDLPGTRFEASLVAGHLGRLGLAAEVIEGSAATEEAVGAAVAGAAVFHFAGHGVGDVVEPQRAALLAAPAPDLVAGGDPFPALLGEVAAWEPLDPEGEERVADTAAGRVTETVLLDGRWRERWLEAGPTSTVWAHYVDGRLVRIGERWSAGDLLVDERLSDCRLAVLSSCSSAVGSLSVKNDEAAGLPAALELAGVDGVVATAWPVDDPVALLFSAMLYEAIEAAAGEVDVGDLVDHVRSALRRMPADEARARFAALRKQATDPMIRLRLEGYLWALNRDGRDRPFADPWQWAAFTVSGGAMVERSET